MTELDRAWAESQVESMADGSLAADAERRMRALMETDAGLAASVEYARRLRLDLRNLGDVPVPRGLFWRLWRTPGRERRASGMMWVPAGALATAVVAVLGWTMFTGPSEVAFDEAAQAEVLQDFAVAVAYLQKSTLMAQNEVNQAMGSGVLSALEASRGLLDRAELGFPQGEQDNDD